MQRIRTEFHISSGMVQFGGWRDSEMMRCLLIWKSSMSNVEKSSFGGGGGVEGSVLGFPSYSRANDVP